MLVGSGYMQHLPSRRFHLAVAALGAALAAVTTVVACSSDDPTSPGGPAPDAATDGAVADAAPEASGKDANGPGAEGDECSFNRNCAAALRCECSESAGCACKPGVRGTGKNGVDPCPGADGTNACESALCIEGPDGAPYCSDECATNADCTGQLPVCTDVVLVGRVCVRTPPEG